MVYLTKLTKLKSGIVKKFILLINLWQDIKSLRQEKRHKIKNTTWIKNTLDKTENLKQQKNYHVLS